MIAYYAFLRAIDACSMYYHELYCFKNGKIENIDSDIFYLDFGGPNCVVLIFCFWWAQRQHKIMHTLSLIFPRTRGAVALSTSTHRHSPQNIHTTFLTLFSLIPTRNRPTEEERMHTERRCSAVAALGRWQNTCVLSYAHTYTRTHIYIKNAHIQTHNGVVWTPLALAATGPACLRWNRLYACRVRLPTIIK